MLHFRQCGACIRVDSTEIAEYQIRQSKNAQGIPEIFCWIPSESGKMFDIETHYSIGSTATRWTICIDGKEAGRYIMFSGDDTKPVLFNSVRISATHVRPLQFAPVRIIDIEPPPHQPLQTRHKDFGSITVLVTPIEAIEKTLWKDELRTFHSPSTVIHESDLKSLASCQVTLAKNVVAKPATAWNTKNIGKPIVKFVFKYRPIEVLCANGLALNSIFVLEGSREAHQPTGRPQKRGRGDADHRLDRERRKEHGRRRRQTAPAANLIPVDDLESQLEEEEDKMLELCQMKMELVKRKIARTNARIQRAKTKFTTQK